MDTGCQLEAVGGSYLDKVDTEEVARSACASEERRSRRATRPTSDSQGWSRDKMRSV